jgi:hypothetical protein
LPWRSRATFTNSSFNPQSSTSLHSAALPNTPTPPATGTTPSAASVSTPPPARHNPTISTESAPRPRLNSGSDDQKDRLQRMLATIKSD